MEQFVLVSVSEYNKSSITQAVTKQNLPKYQPSQNSMYQIDSLKNEETKFFSKVDSLVDKVLSCQRIRLSNLPTLFLEVTETGFFCLDFAQQLRRKT